MNKKYLLIISILFFCFYSCGKKNKKTNTVPTAKTISLWEHEDSSYNPYLDSAIAEFEKANAGFKVVKTHYPQEDLYTQFQNATVSGTQADIVLTGLDKLSIFIAKGFINPVDGAFDFAQYVPAMVSAAQLDGKTWAVPHNNANRLVLYYNKEFVKTVPNTTNELLKLCEELVTIPAKKTTDKMLTCMEFAQNDPLSLLPFLTGFGGWFINGHKATLNTEAMIRSFEFIIAMKKLSYVSSNCDAACVDSMFKDGDTAMVISNDLMFSNYSASLKDNIGVAILPVVSDTGSYMASAFNGKYFLVSKSVKDDKMDAVKKLINTFNSVANQTKLRNDMKILPVLKSLYEGQDIQNSPVLSVSARQSDLSKAMPIVAEDKQILDVMKIYMSRVLSEKAMPADAAKQMQEEIQKIKEDKKDEKVKK